MLFILIIGSREVAMPSDFIQTMDENVIAHRWNHSTMNIVSHYIVEVDAEGLRGQEIRVDTQELLIPQIPDVEYAYNGNITAVGVCGGRSDPLSFSGMLLFLHCV